MLPGSICAADHFHAPELARRRPARRPSRGRAGAAWRTPAPPRASASSAPWNVAVTNMPMRIMPGIVHLDAHLRRADDSGSSIGADVADPPLEHPIGIGIQTNVGVSPDVNVRQVVLIDVADDPDVGEIGDREQVGRIVQRLDAGRRRHVLLGDHAGDRRRDIHDRRWDGSVSAPRSRAGAPSRFPRRPSPCPRHPAPLRDPSAAMAPLSIEQFAPGRAALGPASSSAIALR